MRGGAYEGWLPTLFLGELLSRKIVGVVGAGRIGSAFAAMMVQAFKMDLVYFDTDPNLELENRLHRFSKSLKEYCEAPTRVRRAATIDEVLTESDVVSLHLPLDESTRHLINRERLALMKKNAILVNTSRGPVVDETALVAHCTENPGFKAGLDVFEDEPRMKPGLSNLENVVLVPHIASATNWSRRGMAVLAASNLAAILNGWPAANSPKRILDFVDGIAPDAAPSIVNAVELGIPTLD